MLPLVTCTHTAFSVVLTFVVTSLRYDTIYLLTAIGLSPGGITHLHTNNTYNNTNNNGTTQITSNVEECGVCPVFASSDLSLRVQYKTTTVQIKTNTIQDTPK
jgi:hypothetical protein